MSLCSPTSATGNALNNSQAIIDRTNRNGGLPDGSSGGGGGGGGNEDEKDERNDVSPDPSRLQLQQIWDLSLIAHIRLHLQNGAEDLRIKNEPDYSPLGSNTQPPTPTTPGSPFVVSQGGGKGSGGASSNVVEVVSTPTIDTGLTNLANIATADMLNIWTASKLASKGGSVNTADGNYHANSVVV